MPPPRLVVVLEHYMKLFTGREGGGERERGSEGGRERERERERDPTTNLVITCCLC